MGPGRKRRQQSLDLTGEAQYPTRRRNLMTEEQLAFAAERLANAQEKFVEGVRLVVDTQVALVQRLRVFEDFLNISQELKAARDDEAKRTLDSFQALVKAFIESNVNIRENSERMDRLLTKVDSYFGSGEGLENEN